MLCDLDIEKSDLHSRGGRFAFSLTEPDHDLPRERSLVPEDGLESPEKVVRERDEDTRESERDGDIADAKRLGNGSLRSSSHWGCTCTQSSFPCVTPVGMGTCVTAGDALGQPEGPTGCVGNIGVSTAPGAAHGVPWKPPHLSGICPGTAPTPHIGVPGAGGQPA